MQNRRFDLFAKRLGRRFSRRSLVGAGMAAALTPASAPQRASMAQAEVAEETTAVDRYIAVRTYTYDSTREKATAELPDLVGHMEEQPGFVALSCVWGDGEIYLVATFLDRATSIPGMETIEWWIETHIQSTLYGDYEQTNGVVFTRSTLASGCPCDLEEEDACDSELLVCCPVSEVEGDPGMCLTAETSCPVGGELADEEATEAELTVSTEELTPTPVAASTSCSSQGCACPAGICDAGLTCCTSTGACELACPCGYEGCACVGAVLNSCDAGLICCAPGEIGAGTCQYTCRCSSEGCSCTTGVEGACDAGLVCCGIFSTDPGNIGACLSTCSTGSNPCPGAEGCECVPDTLWTCNEGLLCCGATDMGESGICQSACSTSETTEAPDSGETPGP